MRSSIVSAERSSSSSPCTGQPSGRLHKMVQTSVLLLWGAAATHPKQYAHINWASTGHLPGAQQTVHGQCKFLTGLEQLEQVPQARLGAARPHVDAVKAPQSRHHSWVEAAAMHKGAAEGGQAALLLHCSLAVRCVLHGWLPDLQKGW